uniref:Putative mitotic protein phosphatase 1 regulator n=1 Tax=Psorophora albipes TaxID=869069 RepID=T1DI76_9DIPT
MDTFEMFQRNLPRQRMSQKEPVLFCLVLLLIVSASVSNGQSVAQARRIECSLEQKGDQEFCVFRNVQLQDNEEGVTFGFPGAEAPSNVAFEKCAIPSLPTEFWTTFGENLLVLEAESCGLTSIMVTNAMEMLRIRNNSVNALTVQQNCNLTELDVRGNRFDSVKSFVNCRNLKMIKEDKPATPNNLIRMKPSLLSQGMQYYLDFPNNETLPTLYNSSLIASDVETTLEIVQLCAVEPLKYLNNAEDYRLEIMKSSYCTNLYILQESYRCCYLTDILANIDTSKDDAEKCEPNDVQPMYCLPEPTQKSTSASSTTTSTTASTTTTSNTPETPTAEAGSSNTMRIILAVFAVAVLIAITAAGGGIYVLVSRKQRPLEASDLELQSMGEKKPTEE